ncbi:MAG: penicillin-binding protein 1C [Anaeromyxobacter sp. RBG_16_69_14]|nr:MAG: penicillin-binding protein 1C [Anaeromyxobacter sp. RBG_16_69_14]
MSCERKIALAGLVASVVAGAWLFLPRPPLKEGLGFSRAVFDREGRLLRLTLAPDERYRLWVPLARISPRVVEATLLHEDRFFRLHPGVNPVAIVRAAFRTYVRGGRRMGGSTLTMQLARIRYRVESRSAGGKLLQILRALQLERHYSKGELLEAYLNFAPYGRNIEGVGAASLVYFEKEADRLGLDEALALAVIPQSPARRAPGSPGGALEQARAALGRRWFAEPPADGGSSTGLAGRVVARAPESLPFLAPHFVEGVLASGGEWAVVTTLDLRRQRLVERALRAHVERRRSVGIDNAAALLLDRRSMEVLASVGSADFFDARIEGQVDGTRAKRSPGSALKPFVYALAVEQGLAHPRSVLKDAPARFRGYDPENFDGRFAGPLSATEALVRSRNVPAVDLAGRLDPGLYAFLARAGIARLKPEAHYGLALVLGGTEATMEELVRLYALLANGGVGRPLRTRLAVPEAFGERLLSEEAAWVVLDMLEQNPRPGPAAQAGLTRDSFPVAWKTGTSHGYRDAWALGLFGQYVLAVWVGRFDGQGNPAFVGLDAAAPLLFQIVDALRAEGRVVPALRSLPAGLARVAVCTVSGKLPGPHCGHTGTTWFLPGVSPIDTCDVHREVLVDRAGRRACGAGPGVRGEVYEFWSSDLLRLFAEAGIPRRVPPPEAPGCRLDQRARGVPPKITSPQEGVTYSLRAGRVGEDPIPLTAVTDADARELFWFVDTELVGKALRGEPLLWRARPGSFVVRAVDDQGRAGAARVSVAVVQ